MIAWPAVAADPRDAGTAVGGFQALHEIAALGAIERRAECGQAAHRVRAFAGQDRDRLRIAEARAGGDGVGRMQLRRVAVGQRRGHAALRPGRGTAAPQRGGGQHQGAARRGGERGGETGQAGADDQDPVELKPIGHRPPPKLPNEKKCEPIPAPAAAIHSRLPQSATARR